MTDKEIVSRIRDLLHEEGEVKQSLKMVGKLTKAQGIKGFKTADVGNPVLQKGDRYIIVMETLDGKSYAEVTYYPDSLKEVMEFIH